MGLRMLDCYVVCEGLLAVIPSRIMLVMPALVAGIHVLKHETKQRRGWPGQARP
jgi:hypothetical protein